MIEIQLGWQGKNKGKYHALVDDEDYEWLSQWKWYAWKAGHTRYAVRKGNTSLGEPAIVLMHRAILGLEKGDKREGDHIYGNGLDNRRSCIRAVSHQENHWNQHYHKGYGWYKPYQRWRAKIRVNGTAKHIGYYDTPEEARAAYLAAKAVYHKIGGQPCAE